MFFFKSTLITLLTHNMTQWLQLYDNEGFVIIVVNDDHLLCGDIFEQSFLFILFFYNENQELL